MCTSICYETLFRSLNLKIKIMQFVVIFQILFRLFHKTLCRWNLGFTRMLNLALEVTSRSSTSLNLNYIPPVINVVYYSYKFMTFFKWFYVILLIVHYNTRTCTRTHTPNVEFVAIYLTCESKLHKLQSNQCTHRLLVKRKDLLELSITSLMQSGNS